MKTYRVELKELGNLVYIWGDVKASDAITAINNCEFLAPSTKYPNGREWAANELSRVVKMEIEIISN